MNYRVPQGNNMVEYCLLFAIILVASVGTMNIFGGSVSKLLAGQGTGSQGVNGSLLAAFAEGNSAGSQYIDKSPIRSQDSFNTWLSEMKQMLHLEKADDSHPTSATGSDFALTYAHTEPLVSQSELASLIGGNENSGVNGDMHILIGEQRVKAFHKTVGLADQMNTIAMQLDESPLKAWYKQASESALLLAGSQASYSYVADGVQKFQALADTSLQAQDALWSIQKNRLELGRKLYDFPADIVPEQRELALNLVSSILNTMWSQYSSPLNAYTFSIGDSLQGLENSQMNFAKVLEDMGPITREYGKTPETVLEMGKLSLAQGDLDGGSGIYTGIVDGSDMTNRSQD